MSQPTQSIRYRAEVDGLRALSVLAVVLFHAGVPGFQGGFWGVDVFFVISGYLITRLLLLQSQAGAPVLADFYLRRARRILPAFYLVLICSAVLAWLILTPAAMLEFCKSLPGSTLFYSNVVSWRLSGGYFAEINELRPLMHTWSLAIEEQFYLFWPPVLLAICTWLAPRRRLPFMWFLLVASSIIGLLLNHYRAGVSFFLPFGRAWELLAGATVAWVEVQRAPVNPRSWQAQLAALLGLLAVLLSLSLGSWGKGPGLPALPVVAGTASLLWFARSGTVAGRLLGFRPLVVVGLCSYSIYLWHQPLFAFARHYLLDEPDLSALLGLAAGAIVLGWLSWKWLETPCRDSSRVPTRVFLPAAAIAAIGLLAFAILGLRTEGFESSYLARLDKQQRDVHRSLSSKSYDVGQGSCRFRTTSFDAADQKRLVGCYERLGPGLVIVGDSHGKNLFRAVLGNSSHPFIVGIDRGGCRPQELYEYCPQRRVAEFTRGHAHMIKAILYTQAGFYLLQDPDGRMTGRETLSRHPELDRHPYEAAIQATENYLKELAQPPLPVFWLGPAMEPHLSGERLRKLAMRCDLSQRRIDPGVRRTYLALDRAIAQRPLATQGITYVSQVEVLQLDEERDLYDCRNVYWLDSDHWSAAGEQVFGARLLPALSGFAALTDLKSGTGAGRAGQPER